MVLTVSFGLSSVTGFLATVASRITPRNLTPASGRQDHTTSPSASRALVRSTIRVHRIPPRVDDVAQRPSWRDGTADDIALILVSEKQKYFCESLWTRHNPAHAVICPSGQIVAWALAANDARLSTKPPGATAWRINAPPPASENYHAVQCAACAVWAGAALRQCRAASISASDAPWLRAHVSAADAENLAT